MTCRIEAGMRVGAMRIVRVRRWRLVRAAEIGQADLGENAVRQNDDIVRAGQQMGRAPVVFDDSSFRAVARMNPVADDVWPAECQCDAGEDVAERILKRKTEE